MNPFKNILLAVDFTEHSNFTLQSAIHFCQETKSALSLIHVVSVDGADPKMEVKLKIGKTKLEKTIKNIQDQGVEVPHTKVVAGNIEKHTMFFADAIKADAILIGSGNDHQNKKHRLGGHAEAILRYSSIPVFILKDTWYPLKGKIACLVDISDQSHTVIKTAIDFAKHISSELVVIHSIEQGPYGFQLTELGYAYAERNYYDFQTAPIENFLKQFDFKGVTWSLKILNGLAKHMISDYIIKHPFSMTIMGSASRTGISRFILGSVAETISRNIDSPCLIIKSK